MSTDTTNLRCAITRARARHALLSQVTPSPSVEVTVSLRDLEAALVELDGFRMANRMRETAEEMTLRRTDTDTEIELPNGQDASLGRTVTVAADAPLFVPNMDFLCTIQEALTELMMKDARGNRPYALLEWCSDSRKTAAWAIITAVQEKRIPGMCISGDSGFWGRAAAKLQTELESVSGKLDSVKGQRDRFEQERDNLRRENLELRSRTVFPKAALAAKLAEAARAVLDSGAISDLSSGPKFISALHAYEKEDAEYPFVPADCDVRRIMVDLLPGPNGELVESYAKNADDMRDKMAALSGKLDDAVVALVQKNKMSIAEARKICEGGHDFGAEKEHREKLKSGVILCINLRWPWGVHWEDGVTDKHFGSEEGALGSIAEIKDADAKKLSARECTRCGVRHKLDEFPQDSRVFVVDSDSPLFGWAGYMHSWSQYGCPITYTLTFGENKKQFDPCQLRATL